MGKDYYALLGVTKDATEEEIKKAYKKRAIAVHPDRNPNDSKAKERFQELGEAFEVLSDGNKRAIYDQYGSEGLKGGGPPPGASGGPGGASFNFGGGGFHPSSAEDIFASVFGGGGLGGGGGNTFSFFSSMGDDGPQARQQQFGGFPGGFPGAAGGGFGGFPGGGMGGMGGAPSMGGDAGGAPPADFEKELPCSLEDLYKGTTKKLKIGTRTLSGGTQDKVLTVEIKKGWKKGTRVRFGSSGNEMAPGKRQDIVFIIAEKPHPNLRRDGDDLHVDVNLSLADALDPPASGAKSITTLDGRSLSIPFPKPGAGRTTIPNPHTTRIAGEGMPISKTGGVKRGDLIVHWNIAFPARLSPTQSKELRRILGGA